MNSHSATRYRRAAARVNYLAQDRPDLSFAAKEVSRGMANPDQLDERRLKRVLRYLRGTPRASMKFEWQERPNEIVTYTDSDWAGCSRTRKSTSGGTAMMGKHLIVHWSSTQATIALSVAEAELNGMTKGVTESLFLKHLSDEIGLNFDIEIRTDSSARRRDRLNRCPECGQVSDRNDTSRWPGPRRRSAWPTSPCPTKNHGGSHARSSSNAPSWNESLRASVSRIGMPRHRPGSPIFWKVSRLSPERRLSPVLPVLQTWLRRGRRSGRQPIWSFSRTFLP